ncbi:hypothetical protein PFICI_10172 [Pestalotiopsis fici W106-1]|uniref:BZIP domain-containing protein n=1 Tax=Pestalotiopsis fici (strain W106-1 / CGMCC3.15140) TaxID=1229662 RepID=W3WW81_PESFW|nr:uncharacterized protein PFICI_10172 [Pestalotiopsis fici W106-1]ETS78110.1 hypothetical protein PFICI_10172 [Pestalotiopsis fici W106-1]
MSKRARDVGNPLDSSPEGTKKRREKGRLAQRAFRQKQIDTIRILKDENQKFRDAIAAISAAAAGNQTALGHAIEDAQILAGTGRQGSKVVGRVESNPSSNEAADSSIEAAPKSPVCEEDVIGPVDDWSHQNNFEAANLLPSPSNDLALKITGAPEEIAPYLGPAAYSVAGQIHWIAIAYSYASAKALREAASSLHLNKDSSRAFGKTLQYVTIDDVLCVLRGRLMYRKQGFMAGDENQGHDPWMAKVVMMTIVQNCAPSDSNLLFTAFDVADCLRCELGDRFAQLEAALAGTATDSWAAVTREFVRELAFQAICYGAGPRWRIEHVVEAAQRWAVGTSLLRQ